GGTQQDLHEARLLGGDPDRRDPLGAGGALQLLQELVLAGGALGEVAEVLRGHQGRRVGHAISVRDGCGQRSRLRNSAAPTWASTKVSTTMLATLWAAERSAGYPTLAPVGATNRPRHQNHASASPERLTSAMKTAAI